MSGGRWVVRCHDYRTTHKTREAAEAALRKIEQIGGCHNPHTIEEE